MLINLLNTIYNSDVRINAIKKFNELLMVRMDYDRMKYDVCWSPTQDGLRIRESKIEQSPLVNALCPDIKYYDNAFWEHLMHLVYLTAFGTIRQWSDMWEELMLVKPYLHRAGAADVIERIENYITNFKKDE